MRPLISPLERRFVFVTGKGGVGKSTVTATLGLRSARAGKKTLICELNTQKEAIAPLFGHEPVGSRITELTENLFCVNIEPAAAMEEYALLKLRFRALYKLVFDNPLVQALVGLMPGMNDLLMLGKAFNHERETDRHGAPVWERILVDAPATGHGITLFRLPRVIRDVVPAGTMHREAGEMWSLLTNPDRTAVHLVTLPEELPVTETRELCGQLRGELGLPLGHLFINRMPPPLLDESSATDFARLTERPEDPYLAMLWQTTRVRLGQEARALHYAEELADLGLPVTPLPLQYAHEFGYPEIMALSEAVESQ